MRLIAAILVILIGIALIIKMATGSLGPDQLTGIAILLIGIAFFLPEGFPNWPARG